MWNKKLKEYRCCGSKSHLKHRKWCEHFKAQEQTGKLEINPKSLNPEFSATRRDLEGSLEEFVTHFCSHKAPGIREYKPKQVDGKLAFTEISQPEE